MKKFTYSLFFGLLLCATLTSYAQVPAGIQYQAVARDAGGNCLQNETISLQMSILDGAPDGPVVYQERFEGNVQTNAAGHFSVMLGSGTPQTTGQVTDFSDIRWLNSNYYLQVEYAPGSTTAFVEVGTAPFLTVPYALNAANGKQYSDNLEDEYLQFFAGNGNENVRIGGMGNPDYFGFLSTYDDNGEVRGTFRSQSTWDGAGRLRLEGPNDSRNIELGIASSTFNNNGSIGVYDQNDERQVRCYVNSSNLGVVEADVKNFVIPHPEKPGKEIVYACIEGPEVAAYERGMGQLKDGEAEVFFSKTFRLVANPQTMTVVVTPYSADSKGLAIVEQTATGFKVRELYQGQGNYSFSWEVKAVRKGYEDFKSVRDQPEDPNTDPEKDN